MDKALLSPRNDTESGKLESDVDELFHELDRSIFRFPGVLSREECDRIIAASRPHIAEYNHPGADEYDDEGSHLTPGVLLTAPCDDPDERPGRDIVERLATMAHWVNTVMTSWKIELDVIRFGVSLYRPGHYMAQHVDDERRGPPPWDRPHRGISMSLPLSQGHQGGGLRLATGEDEWVTVRLNPGDAVLFGSSLPHEVAPVTSGERWVLLMWLYTHHKLFPTR
ncbi:MAG TPA: 2OG-Fe(II) oxygenase [Micromonosporaceae bacterium]|nr:2OG-Fe(II) oxygenase [Micromonosporaceae bacterium]